MRAIRLPGRTIVKIFLVLLLSLLAFQSSGINSLAAPEARSQYFQEGESQLLTCGCSSTSLQVVLMIDDSGSMRTNDRGSVRNEIAKNLVDQLSQYQQEAGQELQDIQIAVVHFTDVAQPSPQFVSLNPDTKTGIFESIDLKPSYKTPQTTSFAKPFGQVRQLFTSGDCTRRTLVLLTDGTPEDTAGRLTGASLLDEFSKISPSTQELLTQLDKISLVLFKVNPKYFDDQVKAEWGKSTTTDNGEKLVTYTPDQGDKLVQDILDYARDESFKEFNVDMQVNPTDLIVGSRNEVQLTLLPPQGVTLQDVSILPAGKTNPLSITQNGDAYGFSWTPEGVEASKFTVKANASIDEKERVCSGDISLPGILIPVTGYKAISLVIMPPREPMQKGQPVVLPMRLNYDGEIKSINWQNAQATVIVRDGQDVSETLTATVVPDTQDNRKANLMVSPIDGQGQVEIEIVASVGALVGVDSPVVDINIPDSPSNIVIPPSAPICEYDKAWDFWFWPLAIVLVLLFAGLLFFRMSDAHTHKDYKDVRQDTLRIRKWRFLFVPFLVLLIFLILNRLWWCYIIPWWLFVALLVGLILAVFPLAYFFSKRWRRILGLAFVLLATIAIIVASITIDPDLSWLLVVLLLTLLIRWYIRPDETPKPHDGPPVVFSLFSTPACVPFNESISIPFRWDNPAGDQPAFTTEWQASAELWDANAQVIAQGEPQARVATVNAKRGEYKLVVDALPYRKDAKKIVVKLLALGASEDERLLEIFNHTTTIDICPPDKLAELEGIGPAVRDYLYENGILTFKQLAGKEVKELNNLLDSKPWDTTDTKARPQQVKPWKMMDAKTWPQQAKLAAIAEEFGSEKDREDFRNFEAYKDWLKDGIEPDEREVKEDQRRPAPALPWNGIPQFTPLVLHLVFDPGNGQGQTMRLPLQLNRAEDAVQLAAVDWEVQATVLPGGAEATVTVNPLPTDPDRYELVVGPVTDPKAREVRLSIQACVNGRSIEIYHGKALALKVSAPSMPDNLFDLEGIGATTEKFLNEEMRIFTFAQLALTDYRDINELMDRHGQEMRDAKTWPQQARLAYIARQKGRPEDQRSYEAYKAWLKAGIEPDEHDKDEIERRPEALVWHGTAELTENAYPEIFKRQ